jgi:hypothetical protein
LFSPATAFSSEGDLLIPSGFGITLKQPERGEGSSTGHKSISRTLTQAKGPWNPRKTTAGQFWAQPFSFFAESALHVAAVVKG